MSDWDWKKFIYTFATTSIDPMVRKAFNSLKLWLDNWVDMFNDLADSFGTHWPRHEFGGDDEGTVESLATDGAEGTIPRGIGGRELEMTDRLTVSDADQTLTALLGNTGVDGLAVHDGIAVSKRTAVKFERGHTEPLLNGDMEDVDSGDPAHWDEVVVWAGGYSVQNSNTDYVFKGSHSWLFYTDSPVF